MKKVFSVLTVAVLAVSTVFAGFAGEFSADYTADFAGKNYGFNNDAGFTMEFDATTGSTANENDVYAKLVGAFTVGALEEDGALEGAFELKEASLNGANWNVDLAKMAEIGNYAGGFVKREYDSVKHKSAAQNLFAQVKTTNGVTAVYDGWTLGLGMNFKAAADAPTAEDYYVLEKYTTVEDIVTFNGTKVCAGKDLVYKAYADQDAINKLTEEELDGIVPVLVGQVVPVYKHVAAETVVGLPTPAEKEIAATFAMKELALLEDSLKINANAGIMVTGRKNMNLGFGAKVAYEQDKLNASIGSDMVVEIAGDKTKFKADVAADFAYDFVNAKLYYATDAAAIIKKAPKLKEKNLLDVQLGVDLNSFEVPLALTFTAGNLVNDKRTLDFEVESAFMEGAKVGGNFGITLYKSDLSNWKAGINGEYNLENVAKFTAGVGLKGADKVTEVSLNVAAENTTLIENAALKLEYASKNFLDKDKAAGALTASVGIEF